MPFVVVKIFVLTVELLSAAIAVQWELNAMQITADQIKAAKAKCNYDLCSGAFGTQSDCQSIGYDSICALAMLEEGNSYDRINAVRKKLETSAYHRGFQEGWDDKPRPEKEDEIPGWEDGKTARGKWRWRYSRPNDGWYR